MTISSSAIFLDSEARARSRAIEQRGMAGSVFITVSAGKSIYREGERASSIYQVISGAIRVYQIMQNGNRHIFAFYGPGEWFGLHDGQIHDNFAEAICDTQLRSFSTSRAAALPVSLLYLALNSLSCANSRQLTIARQSAVERVAIFIQEMAARQFGGPEFELLMSRADIADYLGLTVESVARSFTKLRKNGIVRVQGRGQRHVYIVNPEALAALGS